MEVVMYTNFIDERGKVKTANYPVTEEQDKKNRRLARRDEKKFRVKASKKARSSARKTIFKIMQNEVANGNANSDLMLKLSYDFSRIFAIKDKKTLFQISKNYSWLQKRKFKKEVCKNLFFCLFYFLRYF